MQSFRTELENPIVEKDIIELERKIRLYKEGQINDERFRSLRLARGIYGQRQPGVQMIRIKLPYGKLKTSQLSRICQVSDDYSTGILHLTTRQDIQIHYVSLDRTPELWAELEKDNITLREACGNTVRNVTASDLAGIDKNEPFDVTPYADALYKYFLRNPICQEMGRKIKIAFSSSDDDTALTYMHDLGFIPKVALVNGFEERGFKVLIGGGLGAQPSLAKVAYEFLPTNQILPYTEAVLRVFDRHGERNNRSKARLKFLINKLGFEEFNRLVDLERPAIKNSIVEINTRGFELEIPSIKSYSSNTIPKDNAQFKLWRTTNVKEQKQQGFNAVYIKVRLGNIDTKTTRQLLPIIEKYAGNDIRVTIDQNLQLRHVQEVDLVELFNSLYDLNLADPGYDSPADITACPGTDTCNLGISNSTYTSNILEEVIVNEYPDLIKDNQLKIKISGCMNSCGQHGMASIGFHGSSLKGPEGTIPALQVLLGGGSLGNGEGRVADKLLKVPSKRGPDVLRTLLDTYQSESLGGEYFLNYYLRKGEKYFYDLLKPFTDVSNASSNEYLDWGQDQKFSTAIGVGECAGVVIDLVSTLLYESEEKIEWSVESFNAEQYADSIYNSYASIISTAKALLLGQGKSCNTQAGIIKDFQTQFIETGLITINGSFQEFAEQINKQQPNKQFALSYLNDAKILLEQAKNTTKNDKN